MVKVSNVFAPASELMDKTEMNQDQLTMAVHDHEKRLSTVENAVANATPLLRFVETVQPIQDQLRHLSELVVAAQKNTQEEIGALATEMRNGMGRLNSINEDNMRIAAQQAKELHEAKIKALETKLEQRTIGFWMKTGAAYIGWGTMIGGALYQAYHFIKPNG